MRQMLVRCYDHRVSQTGDFTGTGKGGFQRNALNLAGLYFLHPLVHFSQPGRLYLRVVPVQVFRKTPYQFADLLGRPMAGFRHNLFQGHLHVLTLHHGHIGFSRVNEVEGGGLNRPQLSVPRFHFAYSTQLASFDVRHSKHWDPTTYAGAINAATASSPLRGN